MNNLQNKTSALCKGSLQKKRPKKLKFFNLGLPPPLFPEKLKKKFLVFSETRPFKGHFWKKKCFSPLGGQKQKI